MGHKNEEPIKKAIVDAHKRGVCDKNGKTLQSHLDAHDPQKINSVPQPVLVNSEQYRKNYSLIFGHD